MKAVTKIVKRLLRLADQVMIKEVGPRALGWTDEKAEATSDLIASLGYKQYRKEGDKPELGTFARDVQADGHYTWYVRTTKGLYTLSLKDAGTNMIAYTIQRQGSKTTHNYTNFPDFRHSFEEKLPHFQMTDTGKPYKPDIR